MVWTKVRVEPSGTGADFVPVEWVLRGEAEAALAEAQAKLAAAEKLAAIRLRDCEQWSDKWQEQAARIASLEAQLQTKTEENEALIAELEKSGLPAKVKALEAEVRETNLEMAAVNHCNVEQAKEIAWLKASIADCERGIPHADKPARPDAVKRCEKHQAAYISFCAACEQEKRKPDSWQNHDVRKRGRRSK